jgi:predicted dehydrogenase
MITQRSHAPGFAKVAGVKITALCDPVPENAAKVQAAHAPEARVFADWQELLKSGLIDAVSVATPVYLHAPMTVAALEAGCHVLCEKPMAMSSAEANGMLAAARQAGKVLQLNLSRRYDPFYQTIAQLINDGRIGELRHIRAIRMHTGAPDQGWSPTGKWFVSKKHGGGIVGDIGVHVGDMMTWYFGAVESISAITATRRSDIDVEDNAIALFRFRSGATGLLELSWTSAVNRMCFEIHGTDGVLLGAAQGDGLQILRKQGAPEQIPPAQYLPGVKNSFQCFADAIRGIAPSPAPGAVGYAIQVVLDAIRESGRNGGRQIAIAAG